MDSCTLVLASVFVTVLGNAPPPAKRQKVMGDFFSNNQRSI